MYCQVKTRILKALISGTVSLGQLPTVTFFLHEIHDDINKRVLLVCSFVCFFHWIMSCVNIGKNIYITQWINIFQMINAQWFKIHMWVKYSFKVCNSSIMGFSGTEIKKFIDISDSTLSLIFKKLPLARFAIVSKKIYDDLESY